MPTPPLDSDPRFLERLRAAASAHRGVAVIAEALGIDRQTCSKYLRKHGIPFELSPGGRAPRPVVDPIEAPKAQSAPPRPLDAILAGLRKAPLTLAEIADRAKMTRGQALDWLDGLKATGLNVHQAGERYSVEGRPQAAYVGGPVFEYVSRPDNTYVFGATGDSHLGSKYERLDVLNALYDEFARAGVDRVFHTGNWIDGEARFNKYDLHIHGMGGQLRYLAENYPRRDGIDTFAVAGDDHEGWYGQREGVDIGRHAEHAMRDAGRTDWYNLGFIEAHVRLVNANTGKASILAVVHPGGGSAYALSYTIQKIVESYEGGEKPAVGLYGHYHKMESARIRNVWTLQTGCCQDQTPFMRKRRLEAHVGGFLVTLGQDPETGAITRFVPEYLGFFNRGFYNGRWSHSGEVARPERTR